MRRLLGLALVWAGTGCAGMQWMPPATPQVAPAYKEAPSDWAAARAGSLVLPEAWWTLYRDDELNRLERQLVGTSPDLAIALARYQQARAATNLLRADQSAAVSASLDAQRDRQSDQGPLRGTSAPYYNSGRLDFNFSYEIDLWGRVRQQVASGRALQQAAAADVAAVRLSLQAQLADAVLDLRGMDREVLLLDDAIRVYARAVAVIEARHGSGLSSGLDVARARTQLEATGSQSRQLQARRALIEHAIAALVGVNASVFSIVPNSVAPVVPRLPPALPSTLLQRRPDIAAAQLRVEAASARAGVARTAYFPSLMLSAEAGFQSSDLGKLVQMPSLFWAAGPA